jgi:hypothetical protein
VRVFATRSSPECRPGGHDFERTMHLTLKGSLKNGRMQDSMEPDNFGGLIATGSWDLGPQR